AGMVLAGRGFGRVPGGHLSRRTPAGLSNPSAAALNVAQDGSGGGGIAGRPGGGAHTAPAAGAVIIPATRASTAPAGGRRWGFDARCGSCGGRTVRADRPESATARACAHGPSSAVAAYASGKVAPALASYPRTTADAPRPPAPDQGGRRRSAAAVPLHSPQ